MRTVSSDRAAALVTLGTMVSASVAPTLTTAEVEAALDAHLVIPDWEASTAYAEGDLVIPTAEAGIVYEALIDGACTGATEPTWPTGIDESGNVDYVQDGVQLWRIKLHPPATLWDLNAAAADCWLMKAGAASVLIDGAKAGTLSGNFGQIHDHCISQAKRYRRGMVG